MATVAHLTEKPVGGIQRCATCQAVILDYRDALEMARRMGTKNLKPPAFWPENTNILTGDLHGLANAEQIEKYSCAKKSASAPTIEHLPRREITNNGVTHRVPEGYCHVCWIRWGVSHKAPPKPECATREGSCVGKTKDHVQRPPGSILSDSEWLAQREAALKAYREKIPEKPITKKKENKK